MHLDEFIDYLSLEKNYSVHTVAAYKSDLMQFFEFLEIEAVESPLLVNYSIIRGWIATLLEEEFSKRTANRKIASIKAYYKFLLGQSLIEVNPLSSHRGLKEDRQVEVPFSEEEVRSLLDAEVNENDFQALRDRIIIELLYVTGMRRSEIINLKIQDVDFSGKMIKVLGKRSKERKIPLLENVAEHLRRYLDLRSTVVQSDIPEMLVTDKGLKMYPNFVYRKIKSYFRSISLKVKVSPHILRHSFATHLLNNGADLVSVKELLGHSSLSSTQVYTHMGMQGLKEVYGKAHPRANK